MSPPPPRQGPRPTRRPPLEKWVLEALKRRQGRQIVAWGLFDSVLGLSRSSRGASGALSSSKSLFSSSWSLLVSIFSSQADPPTLKNVDFTMRILTFLKNQRFRSKDGFESVWGLSRAPLGSSWESLGSSFGPLDRPKKASRFALELSWASFDRFLLPNMACGAYDVVF